MFFGIKVKLNLFGCQFMLEKGEKVLYKKWECKYIQKYSCVDIEILESNMK